MIIYYGLLVLIIKFSSINAIERYVNPTELFALLTPKLGDSLVETHYVLKTCNGCKLSVECKFMTTRNLIATIKVYTGEEYYYHRPDHGVTFKNVSIGNYMEVTIDNLGRKAFSLCKAKATKPYLNVPQPEIDSSEHGRVLPDKKKPTCRCGWSNKNVKRISGGTEAGLHEFPFMVRIRYKEVGTGFCGGSIITSTHVLTAAHCVQKRLQYKLSVLVGEHDLTSRYESQGAREIDVELKIVHEDYVPQNDYNDIAILVLKESIPFTDNKIGPVCMPKHKDNLIGQYIKVMGWGYNKDKRDGGQASPVLEKVFLRVVDPQVCSIIYNTDPNTQLCTYNNNKDTCSGDSGGPLVNVDPETNMYYQVGIVSFGRKCASTDPAVCTNVAQYMDWIKEKIETTGNAELCY